jgi:hypothetical protein
MQPMRGKKKHPSGLKDPSEIESPCDASFAGWSVGFSKQKEIDMSTLPQWNSADPETSLIALWNFLHGQAREMFLQAGTHLEILFLVAADGTLQPQPIAEPMTREVVASALKEQIPGSQVYGMIHIAEAWAYLPKGKGDHTQKQLVLGEMGVSDLNAEDRTELLVTSLLTRNGESRAWLDEIVRRDSAIELGRLIENNNSRFPLGNVFGCSA